MQKGKTKLRIFFQLLILIGFCLPSSGQQKFVRSYSVKDGLASNTVYSMLVDKKGYLWFATDAGVSMFDGTKFTNFSAKDGLADNEVLSMFQDNDGRIWFVCFNQQPCFYYKGRFFNARNFKELGKIKNFNWHIEFTNEHEVWISGTGTLYRFRENKIKEFPLPDADGLALITEINSVLYVLERDVFYFLNSKSDKLELYPDLNLQFSSFTTFLETGNGQYILIDHSDHRHTYLYKCIVDPAKHFVEKKLYDAYDKGIVKSILDTKNNILRMIFADNSVIEKDIRTDSLKTIASYRLNSFITDVATDNQGNKWFTLLHGGIEMFPKIQSNVLDIPPEIKNASTYYSIVEMNGKIIVGNNDNTLLFIENGRLQDVRQNKFYPKNNRIIDLKTDRHNKLWLGTDNDVCIYDPGKKQFFSTNVFTNIKDIKYDEANDIMLFASSTGAFTVSCSDPSKVVFLNRERTTCIAGNLRDTCWFETLDGLYVYDGKSSKADTVLSNNFQSRITCMQTDRKGRLWAGTSSNGVFVVEHNKILFHFTTEEGLTSNICKNIFIDELDDAWISTNLGLSHIEAAGGRTTIVKYNDKNCLADNNVNDMLVFKDTVYVVSSTGIVFFNKLNISNNYRFPVYISRIKVGDSVLVAEDSSFNLSSKQNTLNISFSGLSYLSNGDIEYEYFIPELNNKSLFTKNNSVTYSSLSPGTYNFYVSATDVFGNHSIQPAHITFTILPEWYQLLWLRWLAALAFVALAVFITFKYVKQKEKRKLLQAELNQTISRLELEAIHLQINPHFIFNCLNAIQNAIHKNNTESASYFINRFAKLTRKALMLSKESFISIDEEYSFINNYLELEKLRHNNNFDYLIEIDNALDKNATFVPAFILQTFIENSINHGIKYLREERGSITLRFIKTDKLEIRLTDNGIGITASKTINQNSLSQHSSKGLELMYARVESLNKIYHRNIEVKIADNGELNKNEHGTTIIISLDLL